MGNIRKKWCINITEENKAYIKSNVKCGAGYYINQTIFYDEDGFSFGSGKYSWNVDRNNKCEGVLFDEISLDELKEIVGEKRQHIFITEDGEAIYEGDSWYYLKKDGTYKETTGPYNPDYDAKRYKFIPTDPHYEIY